MGVGLLGGSIGMAIKKNRMAKRVCGFFRNKKKIKKALALKAIDEGTDNLIMAVQDADLIILATPVNDIIEKLNWMKSHSVESLITDIGSTKQLIINAAKGLNFIGSHPLAGSEQSGIDHAHPDIFKDSLSILTPMVKKEQTSEINIIRSFWQQLGARTTELSSKTHDHLLAFSSHLPHALACTLIQAIPDEAIPFGAGGLKDTTRIAQAETTMWQNIFISNKSELLCAISAFEKKLTQLKTALKKENAAELLSFLKKSKSKKIKSAMYGKK